VCSSFESRFVKGAARSLELPIKALIADNSYRAGELVAQKKIFHVESITLVAPTLAVD
jgi:hypothetical protein